MKMSHAASQEQTSARAPQVCLHCKSIKKGCDKKLPSCSQCVKRRAVCRYGDPDESRRSGSEESSSRSTKTPERLPWSWNSIPRALRANLPPSIRLSLLLVNSLSEVLPSSSSDPKALQASTNDNIFQKQIAQIFRNDGKSILDTVAEFFDGVHKWLPIFSPKRFHDRLSRFQINPTADLSILLLAMRLIIQYPSADSVVDQDREVLYLATKSLFAQIQAFIPSSLPLVQAGLIITHYEHAHGMIQAAYVSMGTTSRMAFALGLHNRQCSLEPQGSDAWMDEEEQLCTWWGILMCDRIIASDPQMRDRPLATRLIREDDYLPMETSDLELSAVNPSNLSLRYFVSATSIPGVGSYGREAQAYYLLDKVRTAIEQGRTDPYTLYPLGLELQSLLSTVMEQIAGRWGVFCGATSIIITSLYTLHQTAKMQPDFNLNLDYRATVDGALNTLTRMVIDIATSFNRECGTFIIDILSPSCMHLVRCAQHHIVSCNDFRDPKWLEDFDQLRRMLGFFNRRWVLAGKELHRLNENAEMSMALQM